MSKKEMGLLAFLIFAVLGVQLPAIQRPFAGHYASYQGTVMAAMARNMVRENFSELLMPKTDAIIGGERSLHLNQYPFPSLIAAWGVRGFGGSYEFWGRFQAICFNLLSLFLLILIARRLFDPSVGWVAGAIFALSPYTLIYGQSFMSEACSLFFLLLALLMLIRGPTLFRLLTAGIFFSIAITGRVHWILLSPVFAAAIWQGPRESRLRNIFLFAVTGLALPVAWYGHTYFAALKAANVHTSLFLQAATQKASPFSLLGDMESLTKIVSMIAGTIFTPVIFPFLFVGLVFSDKKSLGFRLAFLGIAAAVLTIFLAPLKVLKHDFYLYGTFPFFVLFAARGVMAVIQRVPKLGKPASVMTLLGLYLLVSARYFAHPIFKASENQLLSIERAKQVQAAIPPEAKVILLGESISAAAFYLDHPSWQVQPSAVGGKLASYQKVEGFSQVDLEELEKLETAKKDALSWIAYLAGRGAGYLLAPDRAEIDRIPELSDYLKSHHQSLVEGGEGYYFFKLAPPIEMG